MRFGIVLARRLGFGAALRYQRPLTPLIDKVLIC